jgi:hypothetical protein
VTGTPPASRRAWAIGRLAALAVRRGQSGHYAFGIAVAATGGVSALQRLAQVVELLDQPLASDEQILVELFLMTWHDDPPVPKP